MKKKSKWLIVLIAVVLGLVSVWFLDPLGLRKSGLISNPPLNEAYAPLQGHWQFVSMEVDGKPKPDAEYKHYKVVIERDVWTVLDGNTVKAETPFDLDPDADPRTIDLYPSDGRLLQGIYKLEGDRFTMCDRGMEKGDRPTAFATEPDSGLVLVVLQRVND